MIPLWMFPMAIVCGNTFVAQAVGTGSADPMLLAELALQARRAPGCSTSFTAGKRAVDAICTHPDIVAVSFVGSTAVGTHVYNLASQHGRARAVHDGCEESRGRDADANEGTLAECAGRLDVRRRGAACMATSVTVLVGDAQKWIPDIVSKAKTLKVNAGSEKGTDLGPVVSRMRESGSRVDRGRFQGRCDARSGRTKHQSGPATRKATSSARPSSRA